MADGDGRWSDLAPYHELRTIEELQVVAHPLRVKLCRLLKEREYTVRELSALLGETSTRLYYHVAELERVGLVRLVRTDIVNGLTQKYYRAVARYLTVPFTMLQDERGTERAMAGVEWYASLPEAAAKDVRVALTETIDDATPDFVYITRTFVHTTQERAREIVARLKELQGMVEAADEEGGDFRISFTAVLVPTVNFVAEPSNDLADPAEAPAND